MCSAALNEIIGFDVAFCINGHKKLKQVSIICRDIDQSEANNVIYNLSCFFLLNLLHFLGVRFWNELINRRQLKSFGMFELMRLKKTFVDQISLRVAGGEKNALARTAQNMRVLIRPPNSIWADWDGLRNPVWHEIKFYSRGTRKKYLTIRW